MKNKPLIIILLFLIFIASNGCIDQDKSKLDSLEKEVKQLREQINESEKQRITPLSTSPQVVSINLSNGTKSNTTLISTPVPASQYKEFPRYSLYVTNDMETPIVWGTGSYQIDTWKIKIMNQQNEPLSLKAQVRSGEQIIEEYSFTLENLGSTKEFTNQKRYIVNNTNFTMKVLIEGYAPLDYKFNIVTNLN